MKFRTYRELKNIILLSITFAILTFFISFCPIFCNILGSVDMKIFLFFFCNKYCRVGTEKKKKKKKKKTTKKTKKNKQTKKNRVARVSGNTGIFFRPKPVLVWCKTNDQTAFGFTSTNGWSDEPVCQNKQAHSVFEQLLLFQLMS